MSRRGRSRELANEAAVGEATLVSGHSGNVVVLDASAPTSDGPAAWDRSFPSRSPETTMANISLQSKVAYGPPAGGDPVDAGGEAAFDQAPGAAVRLGRSPRLEFNGSLSIGWRGVRSW